MQCYNPITISNRKLHYKSGFDKPSLVVPCGKCLACQSSMQNDWTIRIYFHWKKYINMRDERGNKGRVLFITNTYRQNDSPIYGKKSIPRRFFFRVDPYTKKRTRVNFTCFSKEHIDTYINSVRKYFRRHYDIGKNSSDTSINYIVCCEYGSTEGKTHAPHYHIFLFFPPCSASNEEIRNKCDELWSHGFSLYTPMVNGGAFVNTIYAIKYVAKYCCKDLAYYSRPEIKELVNDKKKKKYFRHALPTHWQSNGFGESMSLYLNSVSNPFESIISGVRMECDLFRYNVPLYVRNKMLYDIYYLKDSKGEVQHTLRKLNEFGYKFYSYKFDKDLDSQEILLKNNLTAVGLSRFFSDNNDLKKWYKEFFNEDPFDNYNIVDLRDYLISLVKPFNVRDLAKYSLVFRGHVQSDLTRDLFGSADLLDSAKDVYMVRALDDFKEECTFADLYFVDIESMDNYNLLSKIYDVFTDFESCLLVLDDLKRRLSKFKSEASYQRYVEMKKIRDQFKYK